MALISAGELPSPIESSTQESWHAAKGTESVDQMDYRIDTACAARLAGGIATFASDFGIVDTLADPTRIP